MMGHDQFFEPINIVSYPDSKKYVKLDLIEIFDWLKHWEKNECHVF